MAGRYVAFASSPDFSTALVVKDLKTGKDRTRLERGVTEDAYTAEAFVLSPAGALAFLGESAINGQQLELVTAGLNPRVVDQGSIQGGIGTEPSISPESLGTNIAGTTLYWTNAGQLRTAAFK